MRKLYTIVCAALAACSVPQESSYAAGQNTYTSKELLEMDDNTVDWFIASAVLMAGQVAGINDVPQGKCVWDWYFTDIENSKQRIKETMNDYPDYSPTGVILAVLQKECGTIAGK